MLYTEITKGELMPKWKKDETVFQVSVSHNEVRGAQSSIPKPIYDALGQPETIKFVLKGKQIIVQAGDNSEIDE